MTPDGAEPLGCVDRLADLFSRYLPQRVLRHGFYTYDYENFYQTPAFLGQSPPSTMLKVARFEEGMDSLLDVVATLPGSDMYRRHK